MIATAAMSLMADNPRLDELRRRVERDPASISFAALAEEYRRAGLLREAVETCRSGLQRHPFYVSARVTLGRALVELGEFDEASAELEQALRAAPENLAAIRALAAIHKRRSEISEATDQYVDQYGAPLGSPTSLAPAPPEKGPAITMAPPPEAVQAKPVASVESPALARLEAFLVAIQRARRDVAGQAAR